MATTFHSFPRLPTELRLTIWKLAYRPCTADRDDSKPDDESTFRGALHYFGSPPQLIDEPYNSATDHSLKIQHLFTNKDCRSAFHWDAGLVHSCRESRDVVQSLTGSKGHSEKDPHRSAHDKVPLCSCQGHEVVHQLVVHGPSMKIRRTFRPARDILVLALEPLNGSHATMESWSDWLESLASCNICGGPNLELNIGLDFDETWQKDILPDQDPMPSAPKELFTALLLRSLLSESAKVHVWLIERDGCPTLRCRADTSLMGATTVNVDEEDTSGFVQGVQSVYYDFDTDYVDLDIWDTGRWPLKSPAAVFLYKLGEGLDRAGQQMIVDTLGVLAPKDSASRLSMA